jgi:hypothetical protein
MIGQWSALSLQPKGFKRWLKRDRPRQGEASMSLRKRPAVTPALLAANRANARRSTGPRTVDGKNRIVLNALKDGRHARHFSEKLLRAKSRGDAELFQWILEQVRTAFRLRSWQQDDRQAERLAQRVWCALEREERRCYTVARQLGKGRVRFPRRSASLWALPWTPRRLGGLETNPEYAVKSTDRFLTSLARIQVEITDQRKVPLLKFWVRRSPLRPLTLPPWAEVGKEGLAEAWAGLMYEGLGNAEKGLDKEIALAAPPAGKGVGTKPECAVKSTDGFLTPVSRIPVQG